MLLHTNQSVLSMDSGAVKWSNLPSWRDRSCPHVSVGSNKGGTSACVTRACLTAGSAGSRLGALHKHNPEACFMASTGHAPLHLPEPGQVLILRLAVFHHPLRSARRLRICAGLGKERRCDLAVLRQGTQAAGARLRPRKLLAPARSISWAVHPCRLVTAGLLLCGTISMQGFTKCSLLSVCATSSTAARNSTDAAAEKKDGNFLLLGFPARKGGSRYMWSSAGVQHGLLHLACLYKQCLSSTACEVCAVGACAATASSLPVARSVLPPGRTLA